MIKIESVEIQGLRRAIWSMRNPMNSWDRSDSMPKLADCENKIVEAGFEIGPHDLALAKKLASAGPVHGKFLRMITVYMDVTAPLYWWKEFDTYKVGTVANSCSTMHKIHAKPFTPDDFSHDKLYPYSISQLDELINMLNFFRKRFVEEGDKNDWWQLIQLLPSSYNQKRTVMLNYEVCRNIYTYRKDHKLDEWHKFCEEIEKLPYSELIIGEKKEETENG